MSHTVVGSRQLRSFVARLQMLRPHLRLPPVGLKLVRVDTELVSQQGHRHQRCRRHIPCVAKNDLQRATDSESYFSHIRAIQRVLRSSPGHRSALHRVHLEEENRAGHRPARRASHPGIGPESSRRGGDPVRDGPVPCVLHHQHPGHRDRR